MSWACHRRNRAARGEPAEGARPGRTATSRRARRSWWRQVSSATYRAARELARLGMGAATHAKVVEKRGARRRAPLGPLHLRRLEGRAVAVGEGGLLVND